MEHTTPILSARNVHICFNLRGRVLHAIRGIDLDIQQGEVLAIVGESGSGKSVFTKSFMGLLDANGAITEGAIDYFGADDGKPIRLSGLKKEKDWLRVRGHEIAMIMQDPMTSLNPPQDHRGPDRRGGAAAPAPEGPRRPGKGGGIPAGRGHRRPRAPLQAVPARVFGRDAPAGWSSPSRWPATPRS